MAVEQQRPGRGQIGIGVDQGLRRATREGLALSAVWTGGRRDQGADRGGASRR